MPETRHDCPGLCGRTVGYRLFACRSCWPRLPDHMRLAILRTYGRRMKDPAAHHAAMTAASAWYADHAPTRRSS